MQKKTTGKLRVETTQRLKSNLGRGKPSFIGKFFFKKKISIRFEKGKNACSWIHSLGSRRLRALQTSHNSALDSYAFLLPFFLSFETLQLKISLNKCFFLFLKIHIYKQPRYTRVYGSWLKLMSVVHLRFMQRNLFRWECPQTVCSQDYWGKRTTVLRVIMLYINTCLRGSWIKIKSLLSAKWDRKAEAFVLFEEVPVKLEWASLECSNLKDPGMLW